MRAHHARGRKLPLEPALSTRKLMEREGLLSKIGGGAAPYTFQERVLLRTVTALRAARVPTRKINSALRELRRWLNERTPLTRVVLGTTDEVIRVRDGQAYWDLKSGQYVLPLETANFAANVLPISGEENWMKKKHTASHRHYLRGAELEGEDVKAARAAYESCLAGDCSHLEARINLGRLLHLEGLLLEAENIYKAHEEPSAVLYFNLGVLLEDLERELDAIEAYRLAIVHDPGLADAHFNLSLVHERLGEAQAAFRHLLAYRRLVEAHRMTSG